jgi:hypothetical protein
MDYSALVPLFDPATVTAITGLATTLGTIGYGIALMATKLPKATEESPKWYKITRTIIDFIAANFGNAKNG